ncbi:MAG: redoxin domain-containing protein [Pseudomonadota bacterium]
MATFTRRNLGLAAGMAAAVGLSAGALIAFSATAAASVLPGTPAPAITDATTSTGETISLADFTGKTVILEWTNDGCPFVKKHYAEPVRNMQQLQERAAAEDIVWISVISSAPGKQGYVSGAEAEAITAGRAAAPAYTILDPDGDIGRAYSAKTTPHMYIVNPEGMMVYAGAIDSVRSANPDDIADATNYVSDALDAMASGEPIQEASTAPYGCSVKY